MNLRVIDSRVAVGRCEMKVDLKLDLRIQARVYPTTVKRWCYISASKPFSYVLKFLLVELFREYHIIDERFSGGHAGPLNCTRLSPV